AVQVNTTCGAVDETIAVAGIDRGLILPDGTYLRLHGANVTLDVAGQRVSGTATVTRAGATPTVAIDDGSANFGDGAVTLTGVDVDLTADATGLWGTFTGTPAVSLPGLTISATSLTVELNTTA